jgi:hypothetical protein
MTSRPPEDTRQVIPETPHQLLRPDQPPPPSPDQLAAVSAVLNARADPTQQARFVSYLLQMTGVHGGETMMSAEAWAFNAGKRWVAATLLSMAEIRLAPMNVRKVLERDE